MLLLERRLQALAHARAAQRAVIGAESAVTFADLYRDSLRVSASLTARGLVSGDRIAVVATTRHIVQYLATYIGALRIGLTVVSLAASEPSERLRGAVHDADARLIIADGSDLSIGTQRPVVAFNQLHTEPGDSSGGPEIVRDAAAEIVYTSGTTGKPRGVVVTRGALDRELESVELADPERSLLHALPIGSNYCLVMSRWALAAGITTVAMPEFHPDQFLAAAQRFGITDVALVPTMASMLLISPNRSLFELAAVQTVVVSGARASQATLNGVAGLFPNARLVNSYTSTEAWPAGVATEFSAERPDSVGKPDDPAAIAIIGADGQSLGPGEVGEVVLRTGAEAKRRYLRATKCDRERFVPDGVFMGDQGYLDSDGFLFLLGRNDDVVMLAGHKVSCVEIEKRLERHHGVAEAAVVAMPDTVFENRLVAYVTLRQPGTAAELRTFAQSLLASYEMPSEIVVVRELPRNGNGKVLKRELRALAGAEIAPTGSHRETSQDV